MHSKMNFSSPLFGAFFKKLILFEMHETRNRIYQFDFWCQLSFEPVSMKSKPVSEQIVVVVMVNTVFAPYLKGHMS
jgi:hypothetical protein